MPTTDRTSRSSSKTRHRAARVASSWMLVAALCFTGLSVANVEPAGAAPSAIAGACDTAAGVTVIIDFQELGGGTQVYCAPNAPRSGLAALAEAGVSYRPAARAQGFVCQIEGAPASDPCVFESPVDAYWSYWLAPRGGTWCFSNLGAAGRVPPPGTVEGWSFSKNKTAAKTPPPRLSPPPPLAGVAPPAIPASHCTVPNRGVPPTTAPPPTPPPATSPPSSGNPGSSAPSGSGSGSGGGSQAGGSSGGGAGSTRPGSPTRPGSSTKPGGSAQPGETTKPGASGPVDSKDPTGPGGKPSKPGATPGKTSDDAAGAAGSKDASDGATTDAKGSATPAEEATARVADQRFQEQLAAINGGDTRQVTDRADERDGSPLPLVFAAVAAVTLLGIGIRASRRNRAAS